MRYRYTLYVPTMEFEMDVPRFNNEFDVYSYCVLYSFDNEPMTTEQAMKRVTECGHHFDNFQDETEGRRFNEYKHCVYEKIMADGILLEHKMSDLSNEHDTSYDVKILFHVDWCEAQDY